MNIKEAIQELHHQDQLLSKEEEKMTSLGGLLEESSKAGRKSAAHMIRRNTVLDTLA